MTAQLVGTIHFYVGLSTDAKPLSGVRSGSVFHELDTGLVYRLTAGGVWKIDKSVPLSIAQYQAGTAELRGLLEYILLELKAANEANGIEAE